MSGILHDYEYYLNLVLAKKRLFLAVAMAVMTLSVVTAYTLPKQYEAKSTVFLEQNVITDLVKGIAVSPSIEAKTKLLSVALLSRTMMLKVLKELDKDIVLQNERQLDEYLVDITKRTKITYQEKQGVFQIILRDKDALFARDFVNTLTRRYIDDNTSSKREESLEATRFLAEQIETFKKRIDAADDAINRFKSEKGYMLAADELFLRGEIVAAEKKLEELSIKRSELEAKKRIVSQHGPEPGKLAEAEARLSELLGRYTEEHPRVAAARAEVARLRTGKGESSRSRNTALSLNNGMEMLQVEIDAYKEMETRQLRILDESKSMLREIPSVKAALAELVRKKDNESVVYQQLVSRYGQSEVSKQMELQDKSVTFRVLDPAVTPQAPVSPNRTLIILGGIVLGLASGFGVILLRDIIQGGVKSQNQLKELGIPIFAVLPHVPDVAADVVRRRGDRVVVGIAAGVLIGVLAFAFGDQYRLEERASKAKTLVAQSIKKIVNN